MNEHFEPDPLDVLRTADPIDVDRLSSASLARIRARVREDVMNTPTPRRSLWGRRIIGLGGVAAATAVAVALALGGRGNSPVVGPGGSIPPGTAACVEPYSRTALAHRDFAFDGTVTAIDGDRVTFAIGRSFRGASDPTITLDAPGMSGTSITSAGGPSLIVGSRYLVAGDDHFAWACGYTQPFDDAVAAEWAAALAG